ncbi:hypothetical protein SADUNF_Sadunf05G0008800 [Salix dunnii]|uniref:Uncharacterized protein n=1 Tax=Salix dunnii TaxID=1413687 RepID=A0A835KAV4_9ROSI|nr:hypothetical protein SADUNF_Sadunf05G0008800 [Salix dunnii]
MWLKKKPCFLLFVLLWRFVYHSTGVDTILAGQSLSVSQTLLSQNGIFELRFFRLGTSSNIYLGIGHRNFGNSAIVWVANRESPSNNPASLKLQLLSDGNLVLLKNLNDTFWSTTLASSMPYTTKAEAVILDDRNFVIRDGSNQSAIYWQSFDYPIDTWLPGGKLGINKHTGQVQRLISWKNSEDPAPGMFPIGIDPNGSRQFFIEWNRSHRLDWSSGCARKSPLQCQNKKSIGKEDDFLKMSNLTLPANSKTYQKVSAGRCRLDCIENCSCMAYAYNNNNGCSLWEGDLINLQQSGVADGRAGAEIYIRLASSEPELQIGNGSTQTAMTALALAIPTTLITLGLFMYFRYLCKGKLTRKGKEYKGHDILVFDFDTNPGSTNNESSSVDNRKKRWSKNMELPLFSYESVSVATGQFSDKLGEGGFGPAWKLWSSNEASDLMDPTLGDPPSTSMLLRYINIGLLCVQESPGDRPTMSDVISMIVNENVVLPDPKQPAFVADRNMADQGQLMSSAGLPSTNNEHTGHNLLLFDFDTDPNSTNNESISVDNRKKKRKRWSFWNCHCSFTRAYQLQLDNSQTSLEREDLDLTCFSIGVDTISVGQSLSVSQTLVSQNGIFELGFFPRGTLGNIYLGIWYRNFAEKTIVWVANRERPSNNPASSKLELLSDGNLVLLKNPTGTVWSTSLSSSMPDTTKAEAVILDEGNFVIRDGSNPSTIYWQSFDYPTDTWLPGAKLGINKHTGQVQRLISWKNSEDPAPGMFSVGIDPNGSSQFFIEWNRSIMYWTSGRWNGQIFSLIPEMRSNYIYNFSYVSNENEDHFTYYLYNTSVLSRFVIGVDGRMRQLSWLDGPWSWFLYWSQPKTPGEVYGLCGVFGVFHENSSGYYCECLKGFKPLVQDDWSSGCVRKSPLQCQNKSSRENWLVSGFVEERFLYEFAAILVVDIWVMKGGYLCVGDLINLQQSGAADGRAGAEIYIRLAASELELQIGNGSTRTGNVKRKLRTALAVAIPTTLITLGLFMYFGCLCKGKLTRKGASCSCFNFCCLLVDCQNKKSIGEEDGFLKMSNLTLPANSITYQTVSAGRCRWDCIESCSCMAYAYNNNNGCSFWEGDVIDLQQSGVADGRAGAEIYIRLAASEPELQIGNGSTRTGGNIKWKLRTAFAVAIPTILITLGLFMYFRCLCKGKLTRKGKEYEGHDILLFDFDTNPGSTNSESISADNRKKRWSKNLELPLFSYESVSVATEQFSDKLGEGGFGPVYKAWKLWSSNKASDLMDPTLGDPPSTSMLLRYINIGLLCVQESPADRPPMSDVISMIVNEHVALPEPKQPAFVAGRNMAEPRSLMSSAGVPSTNNVTITAIDGR